MYSDRTIHMSREALTFPPRKLVHAQAQDSHNATEDPLRKSKFTTEQIAYCLTQAEAGVPMPELCRKYGISTNTFYRWKTKFGGLAPSEVRRLKDLEEENSRLKKLVADLSLDKQILQDALRKKA